MNIKRIVIVVVLVGMFGWAIYEFVGNTDSADNINLDDVDVGIEKGDIAPDFELETTEGETVKLSDFRGQRVLLNFWATWCPPCRAEMPDMQKFHENEDIVILAVKLVESESSSDNIPKFMDEFSVTFRVLLDEDTAVANLYGIQPIPTSYLIDSNGQIHNKAIGALNYELMETEFNKMN